jgi:hypothetical protein
MDQTKNQKQQNNNYGHKKTQTFEVGSSLFSSLLITLPLYAGGSGLHYLPSGCVV